MENVDSIIIEQLKALRSDIAGMRSEMHTEFRDVKARLSHLEQSLAGVRRDNALSGEDFARQQVSIDSLVERIQRVEKRLELSN
jgi:chromosome segregation ATPase